VNLYGNVRDVGSVTITNGSNVLTSICARGCLCAQRNGQNGSNDLGQTLDSEDHSDDGFTKVQMLADDHRQAPSLWSTAAPPW